MGPAEPDDAEVEREVRLKDLRPRKEPIIILARVLRSERREYTRRTDGVRRPMLTGLLGDGTATLRFTWWDPPEEPIDPGDVLRAGPIELREYRGRLEIVFTRRTHVQPAGAAELPLPALAAIPARKLSDLGEDDDEVRVDVRVESVRARTVRVRDAERTLYEGLVRDDSGTFPFVDWIDHHLAAGQSLRVGGGYTRSFRGRLELVLDERSRVEPGPSA